MVGTLLLFVLCCIALACSMTACVVGAAVSYAAILVTVAAAEKYDLYDFPFQKREIVDALECIKKAAEQGETK